MAFVQAIRVQVREIDLIARFGGDEFIVLFPETTDSQAAEVVERVRRSLAAGSVDQGGPAVELSLSAGIAQLGEEAKTLDALIQRADKMLYRAKLLGRNRVEYMYVVIRPRAIEAGDKVLVELPISAPSHRTAW